MWQTPHKTELKVNIWEENLIQNKLQFNYLHMYEKLNEKSTCFI